MIAPVPNPLDVIFTVEVVIVLLIVVVSFVFLARDFGRPGSRRSYGNLGSALQEIQKIALPQVAHVLQEQRKDTKNEDADGGPDKAGNKRTPEDPIARN